MIKKNSLNNLLLFITALLISIDIYYYLVSFFIFILISPTKKIVTINYTNIFLFLVSILFVLLFMSNIDYLTLPTPFLTLMRYCFLIFIVFYLLVFYPINNLICFFLYLCISIIFFTFFVSSYTLFLNIYSGRSLGYGHIYNPIHSIYVPSPKIALQATLSTSIIILFFKIQKKIKIIIFMLSLCVVLFLQSRASVLLLIVTLVPFLFNLKNKKIYYFIFIILGFIFTYALLNNTFDDYRIAKSIFESKRFLHWEDGIYKFVSHPFGGFSINKEIEDVNYFHNIFLDSARIYGWFSTLLLSTFFLLSFSSLKIYKDKKYYTLYIVSFLILNQDVIIEGNFQLFLMMYIFSTILIFRKNKKCHPCMYL